MGKVLSTILSSVAHLASQGVQHAQQVAPTPPAQFSVFQHGITPLPFNQQQHVNQPGFQPAMSTLSGVQGVQQPVLQNIGQPAVPGYVQAQGVQQQYLQHGDQPIMQYCSSWPSQPDLSAHGQHLQHPLQPSQPPNLLKFIMSGELLQTQE